MDTIYDNINKIIDGLQGLQNNCRMLEQRISALENEKERDNQLYSDIIQAIEKRKRGY